MTATRTPPTPTGAPARPEDTESVVAFAVRGLLLVAAGWFIGDLIGAGVTAAGVASTWRRPTSLVAGGAAVMLGAAAFATVFEVPPESGSLRSNFASIRPTASACGLAAGMLALVAVATLAGRERAPVAAPAPEVQRLGLRGRLDLVMTRTRVLAPLLVVGLVTLVVRVVTSPTALNDTERELVGNLRRGAGFVLGQTGTYKATGARAPLPVLVAAFGPGGAALALVAFSVALVALVMTLTLRLADRSAAVIAGVVTLVLLTISGLGLPATMGATFCVLAVLLGLPPQGPSMRAALAGVAYGLAILSVPLLVVLAPVFVGWMAFGAGRDQPVSPGAASLALALALGVSFPWLNYVHDRFGSWAPSTDMGFSGALLGSLVGLVGVAVGLAVSRRRSPAPDTATD